jgi:hypothetical protein
MRRSAGDGVHAIRYAGLGAVHMLDDGHPGVQDDRADDDLPGRARLPHASRVTTVYFGTSMDGPFGLRREWIK